MNHGFLYRNFTPRSDVVDQSNRILERVLTHIPKMDVGLASMVQLNNLYFCFMECTAQNSRIHASGTGVTPERALESLDENLCRELVEVQSDYFDTVSDYWQPETGLKYKEA